MYSHLRLSRRSTVGIPCCSIATPEREWEIPSYPAAQDRPPDFSRWGEWGAAMLSEKYGWLAVIRVSDENRLGLTGQENCECVTVLVRNLRDLSAE